MMARELFSRLSSVPTFTRCFALTRSCSSQAKSINCTSEQIHSGASRTGPLKWIRQYNKPPMAFGGARWQSSAATAAQHKPSPAHPSVASHANANLRMPDAVLPSTLTPKTSIMFTVQNAPGSLQKVLGYFLKNDINLTRLESRPTTRGSDYNFYVCFEGYATDDRAKRLLKDLEESRDCTSAHVVDAMTVPWFPTRFQDLDEFANEILDAGAELQSDHPGFHDAEYRARRAELAANAQRYRAFQPLPTIRYTKPEIETWTAVWRKLMPLTQQYACKEHRELLPLLMSECGYAENNIPQAADISKFLEARTGFSLRPVAGLLSARNFLYGLAFRVFFSTQYIRHHSMPLYTPEPDICHELLGHAPLFADPAFADFSQEIGLAAIGATDEQITQLARCYWFSVEFGLCKEDGQRKAYGAGLLSSFGELEYSMSDKPEIRPWDPFNAAQQEYPITTYQPIYYIAESFSDAKDKMKNFAESMARPFHVRYNDRYRTVEVDTNLRLLPKQPSPRNQAPLVPPHTHSD